MITQAELRKTMHDALDTIRKAHEEIYGVGSFYPLQGEFFRYWRQLVVAHGADKCAAVWAASQRHPDRRYHSVQRVAANFAFFDPAA